MRKNRSAASTAPPQAASAPAPVSGWARRLERLRRPVLIVAGIGTVLGGLAGYITVYRTVAGTPAAPTPRAEAVPAEALSILLLPLANQTGDPGKQHIADGLTAALTADLSRIRGATIVSAAAAAQLQARQLTLQQAGAEAQARYVLSGSVQADGERVRILAHLTEAHSGVQLWSRGFEGLTTDLFALQDQVTAQIRTSIGPQLTLRAAREVEKRTDSPRAADLMLRLRAIQLQDQSVASLQAAEALSRQVLAIDPGHVEAKDSLSWALELMVQNFWADLGLDRAKRIAMRAEAKALTQQVLAEDPQNLRALGRLAFWAWVSGDIETAQGLHAEALRLDPLNAGTHNNIAIMYRDLGQPERARELLERALALPREVPPHRTRSNLSMVALQQGRVDEAVRLARQAVEGAPGVVDFRAQLALALGAQGDAAAAKAATQELLRLAPHYRLRRPAANAPPVFAWYAGYFASTLEPAARVAGLPIED